MSLKGLDKDWSFSDEKPAGHLSASDSQDLQNALEQAAATQAAVADQIQAFIRNRTKTGEVPTVSRDVAASSTLEESGQGEPELDRRKAILNSLHLSEVMFGYKNDSGVPVAASSRREKNNGGFVINSKTLNGKLARHITVTINADGSIGLANLQVIDSETNRVNHTRNLSSEEVAGTVDRVLKEYQKTRKVS